MLMLACNYNFNHFDEFPLVVSKPTDRSSAGFAGGA